MSSVSARGVTVRAAGRTLLDGVDLTLRAGELVVLAGRNGAGKTLLARCLCGLITPASGTVSVAGAEPRLVFQDTRSQVLGQTVFEDVSLGPRSAGLAEVQVRRRTEQALARTGLAGLGSRDPLTLSGGEQRRLSIAALLALEPQVLLLDEPFSSLDLEGVRSVLELLLELRSAGQGLLVITHDLEKIAAHADRLVLLDDGRIAADGPPGAVLHAAPRCGIRLPPVAMEQMSWLR